MNYSKYQEAIFNSVKTRVSNIYKGSDNIIVPATAGSGKTTTIVKSTQYIPSMMTCLTASFNSHIAENLKSKVTPHSSATLNAIGWRACKAYNKNIELDRQKTFNTLQQFVDRDILFKIKGPTEKIVSLLKANLIHPNDLEKEANKIIDQHCIDIPQIKDFNFIETLAYTYEEICSNTHFFDFDDQKFMPIYYNWPLPQFDYLMIDEAQDLAALDMELCQRMIRKFSIFVGDEYQAIYAFRGAMTNSMQIIKDTFNCDVYPLSVCYRCPDAVIEEIQKINPTIEKPIPNPNGRGLVEDISKQDFRKISDNGDFVLCRTTAPLIKECLKFLGMKKYAYVKGKDIGKNLVELIDKIEPGNCSINIFNNKLNEYYYKEAGRLSALNKDYQLAELTDRVDSLNAIIPLCHDVDGVIRLIKDMIPVNEDGRGVIFMTMHRSKGLETKNVYILRRDLIPHSKAKTDEQLIQERNLLFIAQSRAQYALRYVLKEQGKNEILFH